MEGKKFVTMGYSERIGTAFIDEKDENSAKITRKELIHDVIPCFIGVPRGIRTPVIAVKGRYRAISTT